MKLWVIMIGLVLGVLAGCSKKEEQPLEEEQLSKQEQQIADEESVNLIVLDRSHEMRNQMDKGVEAYKIKPSEVLIADASYRDFVLPVGQVEVGPRAVHLLKTDRSKYYRMVWNEGNEILLNSATLLVVRGIYAFEGLRAGEEYFLAIGHDNFDEMMDEGREFQVIAMYRIEVLE
ncbi:MAG: hypothetical protein ACYTFM_05945 [Planctomycetota bacterium]